MTDLEQLAAIIAVAQGVPFTGPRQRKIAQAIINAGWTAPVEPAPTTCADCGEPLTGDKYTGNWVLRKPQGQHWEHIHRNRCPILDRPLNPYLDN